ASNQVAPYGPIGSPSARATASGTTITMSWSSPARNGRDITTEIRTGDGRGWRTVAASGSESYNVGYSTTRTIDVRTTAAGQTTTAADSATTGAEPQPDPRAWVSHGSSAPAGYYFAINTRDFAAGNYTYECWGDGRQFNDWEGPVY